MDVKGYHGIEYVFQLTLGCHKLTHLVGVRGVGLNNGWMCLRRYYLCSISSRSIVGVIASFPAVTSKWYA